MTASPATPTPTEPVAAKASRVATAAAGRIGDVARSVATAPPPPAVAAAVVPPRAAVRRSRLPEAAAVAGLGGFAVLFGLVKADRTKAWDAAMTLRIQAARHPALERLMRAASWPGFPPQSRIIPPTIIATMAATGLRVEAACQTVAWGSALVSTLAKAVMGRQRPIAGKDLRVVAAPLGGSSFPSGHVLTYVGTYGFMAFLSATLIREPLPRRVAVGGLVGLVGLVGPSRIQQGHHWPTDVTASYLLGTSYLVGVAAMYRRLKARSAGVKP